MPVVEKNYIYTVYIQNLADDKTIKLLFLLLHLIKTLRKYLPIQPKKK